MKSQHRHELETNELAKRLTVLVERVRPYGPTIAIAFLAIVVVMFGWSVISGTSAARHDAAWETYNLAMQGYMPNLELLKESAEEFPGTTTQALADITWADGQVWVAARDYLTQRSAAEEALRRATSTYLAIIGTSRDARLVNRARFGLARIYEMQGELDRAREQYLTVEGAFAELAKRRAEQLDEAKTRTAYDWLATAQAARRSPPAGPGTPGERPEFTAGDFALPSETLGPSGPSGPAAPGTGTPSSLDSLLEGLNLGTDFGDGATPDRYGPETPADSTEQPAD